MTKKQWYGGWSWINPVTELVPVPEHKSTQSITTLKDSDFYNDLFGTDTAKFSTVCELFKGQLVLNAVFTKMPGNYRAADRYTPLTYLILSNKIDFFKILLKTPGVDVNEQDGFGQTPLTFAAYLDKTEYVESLLGDQRVDVNGKNKFGKTPIFFASQDGNADILTMLIDKGGDVNVPNKNGTTPLGIAIHEEQKAVVEILKKKGATPLGIAIHEKREAVVEILKKKGATTNTYKEPNATVVSSEPKSSIYPGFGFTVLGVRGGVSEEKPIYRGGGGKKKSKRNKTKSKSKSKTKRNKRKTK